jgi:DnaK suppressor protein
MPHRIGTQQLAQIEARLRSFFTELADDLADLEADASIERGADGEDACDTASDEAMLGMSLAIMDRDRETLRAVVDALDKLQRGEFGVCEDCDGEIPVERLLVLPWARRCVPCAQEFERQG